MCAVMPVTLVQVHDDLVSVRDQAGSGMCFDSSLLHCHAWWICTGKPSPDSVSNHQVSRSTASPNGNIFSSQFGASAAGTPLRQTISIKLSSQTGPTAAALWATNAPSSLADADAGDREDTNSSPRRMDLTSSADSSSSPSQVEI